MTTVEARLSRLEGVYEHLATKADIAELRSEMLSANAELRSNAEAEVGDARRQRRAEVRNKRC